MADTITINGDPLAVDVVTLEDGTPNVKVARDKVGWGADGVYHDASAANPLPVTDAALATALGTLLTELGQKLEPGDVSGLASQATLAAVAAALAGTLVTAPTSAGDVATTLVDGRKTVTTPATAVALRATLACKWVCVTALKTNTDQVNVGGSGVLATSGGSTGQPLAAGESVTIPVNDAAKVFVDARVAGEGVSFTVGS